MFKINNLKREIGLRKSKFPVYSNIGDSILKSLPPVCHRVNIPETNLQQSNK